MQKCPAAMGRALRSEHLRFDQGFEEGFFFSVSPFAVTAAPDVGDIFFMFFPSVEWPVESVTPDCVWFFADEESLVFRLPLMCELSLMLEPLMRDVSLIVPPVLEAPVVVELVLVLMLEPLLMEPVLSVDAGATAPPAVAVSVVLALLFLLHAVTATRAAATIAMRFMKSSGVLIIRERCATFSASMHSCTRTMRWQ
jgi:hypothetical protein